MAGESVFSHSDYKTYLRARAGAKRQRKGLKSAMAEAIRCQPTYISQVLNGPADLSLEQAQALNEFFGHNEDESRYFLLLVQKERAGTKALRAHFEKDLHALLDKRMVLTARLGTQNTLTEEQRSRYYSSWHFAAIHIALTLPALRTRSALARHFALPPKTVTEVLDFLVAAGLARQTDDGYEAGVSQIRLGNDSALIQRHHTNWRLEALKSLDRESLRDLHYSAVMSVSRKDALRLKDQILEWIKQSAEIVRGSGDEELFGYCIDLFRLGETTAS